MHVHTYTEKLGKYPKNIVECSFVFFKSDKLDDLHFENLRDDAARERIALSR